MIVAYLIPCGRRCDMRRIGTVLLAVVLVSAALTGCGLHRGGAGEQAVDPAAGLSPEAAALTALGFEVDEVEAGATAPTETRSEEVAPDQRWRHRPRPATRMWMRRNLLHGEIAVQTGAGVRTVVVQRGEVTAVSEAELTVASTDGFTQTWTLGDDRLRVLEARSTVEARRLEVGDPVGVAGVDRDGGLVARVIAIDNR
jgi:predicted small secreted protein